MTGFCWRRWAKSASSYAGKELSNKMLPRLDQITIHHRGRTFAIPYLYRPGTGGPARQTHLTVLSGRNVDRRIFSGVLDNGPQKLGDAQ
jgi:hypothetical protein